MTSVSSLPDHLKPAILREANLMELLADTITYRSPLHDILVVLKCGAKVNSPVKVRQRSCQLVWLGEGIWVTAHLSKTSLSFSSVRSRSTHLSR